MSAGIRSGPLGLHTFGLRDGQWHSFKAVDGFPSESVSALALDGHDLWAGGMGYIALLDPQQEQIRKFACVQARSVNKIQTGGGFLWAQFNSGLYRTSLSAVR
jgi:hypothetical protein